MITANDLKVQGIKVIEKELQDKDEAFISYRGKARYIVLDFKRYDELREIELDKAYLEVVGDIEKGNSYTSSAKELVERIESEL